MRQRNKAAVLAAGMNMNELAKLHVMKDVREKQLIKAIENIEDFWERVNAKLAEQEAS